jgi:hypothetical protein
MFTLAFVFANTHNSSYVGGKLVIDAWSLGKSTTSTPIDLVRGVPQQIAIEYVAAISVSRFLLC